jgi:hypothetical protein
MTFFFDKIPKFNIDDKLCLLQLEMGEKSIVLLKIDCSLHSHILDHFKLTT